MRLQSEVEHATIVAAGARQYQATQRAARWVDKDVETGAAARSSAPVEREGALLPQDAGYESEEVGAAVHLQPPRHRLQREGHQLDAKGACSSG